jgi:hypothetical protein
MSGPKADANAYPLQTSCPYRATEEVNPYFYTKEFRDEFGHFKPKGWSVEASGFPQIATDVLEVIRFWFWKPRRLSI